MSDETSKCHELRKSMNYDEFFKGDGVDIGCGTDPISKDGWDGITSVAPYDQAQGDGNTMDNVEDKTYDFAFSSHCLEHMHDPEVALSNWLRVVKSGGYVVFCVPHEIFYEKCQWPSRFNTDHKTSWMLEWKSNLPKSVYVPEFLENFCKKYGAEVVVCRTTLENFDFRKFQQDQTRGDAICQIDVVLRKD